jgi:glycosyltransferase involved in cell wall biosynthesis
MKKISIVVPCYNEQDNVEELIRQITKVMGNLPYDYEVIFIDNCSMDGTVSILRRLASQDKHVKAILNARNFGQSRSPYYGVIQTHSDATITISADLQIPTYVIGEFIKYWEQGYKIVVCVTKDSQEGWLLKNTRKLYYRVLNRLTENPLINDFAGYGLFDKQIVDIMREIKDPYPYVRGIISGIGFDVAKVSYVHLKRKNGKSHNNIFSLFEVAMLGLTNNSKVPLRLATILGLFISAVSFVVGLVYLIFKLIYWNNFQIGLAPLVIGMCFLGGVQLLFLGLLGEYIGAIYTQVLHRPLVIEKERINFD